MKQSDLTKKRFYTCKYYIGDNPNVREGTFYYNEFGQWCHEDSVMLMEVVFDDE